MGFSTESSANIGVVLLKNIKNFDKVGKIVSDVNKELKLNVIVVELRRGVDAEEYDLCLSIKSIETDQWVVGYSQCFADYESVDINFNRIGIDEILKRLDLIPGEYKLKLVLAMSGS